MSDQERLANIKRRWRKENTFITNDIDFLIQQAEEKKRLEARVKELEKDNKRLSDLNYYNNLPAMRSMLEDIESYKQALKYVESELEYAHVTGNEKLCRELIKNSIKSIEQALNQ